MSSRLVRRVPFQLSGDKPRTALMNTRGSGSHAAADRRQAILAVAAFVHVKEVRLVGRRTIAHDATIVKMPHKYDRSLAERPPQFDALIRLLSPVHFRVLDEEDLGRIPTGDLNGVGAGQSAYFCGDHGFP